VAGFGLAIVKVAGNDGRAGGTITCFGGAKPSYTFRSVCLPYYNSGGVGARSVLSRLGGVGVLFRLGTQGSYED